MSDDLKEITPDEGGLKPIPGGIDGPIQKLQKRAQQGQKLSPEEIEFLAAHATAGVTSYVQRKFPGVEVANVILAYAKDTTNEQEITDKMVTGICYQIQFDFDRFKTWVSANRRRFPRAR